MSPAYPPHVSSDLLRHNARTRSGAFCPDVAPARTSADVPSNLEENNPRRRDSGIPEHYRQHNGPQSLPLQPDASASAVPKDQKRNVGKRSRAAAKSPRPAESLLPSSTISRPRILRPSATFESGGESVDQRCGAGET